MENATVNTVIIGVGGQGTLLASRMLGALALKQGLDVKVSEVHGMSQRGGSVVTYIKTGEKVFSPVIEPGEADLVLAFEELEALRGLVYLKKGGLLLYNAQQILPMPVITGAAEYPQGVLERFKQKGIRAVGINALRLAEQAGSAKAVNTVMLGAACRLLKQNFDQWLAVLSENVPAKSLEINKKAFILGWEEQTHVE